MHPDIYKRPLLWCLAALIAGLAFFYRPAPSGQDVFRFLPQKEVTLIGRVESFAVPKKNSQNAVIKVFSVNGNKAEGQIYARLPNFTPKWKDVLEISGRLQQPYGLDLLGNFDWRSYLSSKNIFTEIKGTSVSVVRPAPWPWQVIRSLRADILRLLNDTFPHDLASIAGGILLGERGEQDPALYSAFQDSGAIHLLVASGGNVGFVTLLTLAVCSWFGLSRKKMLLFALGVAGVYTLIAGADAPLVRAYFMTICACTGYFLGRNSGVFQGLLVSCFVILIFQPASVFETGFQMSFLATLAIIICLNNYKIPGKWPKTLRFFTQIFLATLSTQLALLPEFTNVFYKVSVTGLISNMLLVPLASVLMGLSFAYYVCSLLHLGWLLHGVTYGALWLFKALVVYFASFKMSALPVAAWGAGTIIAYYAGLFWVFNLPLKKFARKICLPCLGLVLVAPLTEYFFAPDIQIYLLNEWNKSGALIRTKNGKAFLAGSELDPDKLQASLFKTGVKQPDAILLFTDKPIPPEFSNRFPATRFIRPFEDAWPGDKISFGPVTVKLNWGEHETREGRRWTNEGYSGSVKDNVSYCFDYKDKKACLGAFARFAYSGDKHTPAQRNKTITLKI